jgi:DNA polymerase epsilon subunit 1
MMANYIGIPVGNLPEDMCTLALDVLFARQLESKNHLLWASLSSKPDLGGKELEDLRMENEWESISFRPSSGHVYNREAFEVIQERPSTSMMDG